MKSADQTILKTLAQAGTLKDNFWRIIIISLIGVLLQTTIYFLPNQEILQSPSFNLLNSENVYYKYYLYLIIFGLIACIMTRVFDLENGTLSLLAISGIGIILTCISGFSESFGLFEFGNSLFQIGNQFIFPFLNTILFSWFKTNFSLAISMKYVISSYGINMSLLFSRSIQQYGLEINNYFIMILSFASALLIGFFYCKLQNPSEYYETYPVQPVSLQKVVNSLNDIKQFNILFWLLVIFSLIIQSIQSNLYRSVIYSQDKSLLYIQLVLTPLMGILFDRIGTRGLILFLSSIGLTISYIIIQFEDCSAIFYGNYCDSKTTLMAYIICMISISIIHSTLFTNIALVCEIKLIPFGFGIQNYLNSIIAYNIIEYYNIGLKTDISIFTGLSISSVVISLIIFIVDRKKDRVLEQKYNQNTTSDGLNSLLIIND